ncbi:predicted protein [Histoplasma capsulatum var. duboisii H88]|nr:predicted protein [Histoplasma capsulatum H143]EGC41685.1 predicted protein [Histoplasma capsulatum var. duboisii H88]
MKPIALLQSMFLVHALCAPALLSKIVLSGADTDLDKSSSSTLPYQTTVYSSTGERQPRRNSSGQNLSTRQLKLLRDLSLNHISYQELQEIISWLNDKWPAADDLIQSIQQLVDIGLSDSRSSPLPDPPSDTHDKPLPTAVLMYLGNQVGHKQSTAPNSRTTLNPAEFAEERLTHASISASLEIIYPPQETSIISSLLTIPFSASQPAAAAAAAATTATNSDKSLFATLKAMDIIDELIIWTAERPFWAALFSIYALVLLFLISVVIVEVGDFVWALISTKIPSWRRVILSGPERRLVAVPAAENDEKRMGVNYGSCCEMDG